MPCVPARRMDAAPPAMSKEGNSMNNTLLPGATSSVTPNLQRFLQRLNRRQFEMVPKSDVPVSKVSPAIY